MSQPEGLVRAEPQALATRHELTVEDLIAQVQKIQAAMQAVMKPNEHYGVIPGTGTKPTLLKPGAEKLCLLFRLDPQYESTETYAGPHLTVKSRCTLWHITSGQRMGSGEGSCSTRESKYAYRKGSRLCPKCGGDAIIKGKIEFGGGWLCYTKKGGCGTKFHDGDTAIEGQNVDRVANEDLADQYNTILKMANKRSLVAAVLNVTAASDIFTQDLEDTTAPAGEAPARQEEAPPRREPSETVPPITQDRHGPEDRRAADPEGLISEPQTKRFYAIARGSGWTEDQIHDLLASYKYNSGAKEITRARYDELVERVKQGPGKAV